MISHFFQHDTRVGDILPIQFNQQSNLTQLSTMILPPITTMAIWWKRFVLLAACCVLWGRLAAAAAWVKVHSRLEVW